jgi:hypothetical protein
MSIEEVLIEINNIHVKYVESAKAINTVVDSIKAVYYNDLDKSLNINSKFSEAVNNIYSLQKSLNIQFIDSVENLIKREFNIKFNGLELSDRLYKICQLSDTLVIDPQLIIDNIKQQCGDFTTSGISHSKDILKWYIEKVTVSNNKVSFPKLALFDSWYLKNYDRLYVCYSNNAILDVMFRLLTYFVDGTLSIAPDLSKLDTKDLGTEPHEFKDMNDVESIRFYKNGKVVLSFKSKQIANEFYTFIKS